MPRNLLVALNSFWITVFLGALIGSIVFRDVASIVVFAVLLLAAFISDRERIARRTDAFDFVEVLFEKLEEPMLISEVYRLGPKGFTSKKAIIADLLHRGVLKWDDHHHLMLDETNLMIRKNEVFTRALGFALFFLIIVLTYKWTYGDPFVDRFLHAISALIVVVTLIKTAYLSMIPIHLKFWD